jgi:hypothetical protein
MAYTRGSNANIIVGAAAIFVSKVGKAFDSKSSTNVLPTPVLTESYKETLQTRHNDKVDNIGYTNNGIDITFTPTFGDVMVDQLLDVAKLYKSGMQVSLKTTFAEATLENLLISLAQKSGTLAGSTTKGTWTENGVYSVTTTVPIATTTATAHGSYIDLLSGDLGDYPVERSLIAVGPGLANAAFPATTGADDQSERIYVAYRVISISNVTVSAKRDAATAFDVEFRLLPDDNGAYGKIIDRTY